LRWTQTFCDQSVSRNIFKLELWANTQRDGRPAEYRWRPLFSTPQNLADAQYWSAMQ